MRCGVERTIDRKSVKFCEMPRLIHIIKRQFSYKFDVTKIIDNSRNSSLGKMSNRTVNISHSNAVDMAAKQLHAGNVIALPTDTVYGFACSANNPVAIQKLYDIKGRNEEKPVAICVSSLSELKYWGEASHLPNELLNLLLPGAVTIVLNKSSRLDNPYLNPGAKRIGIRIPDYEFIRQVSAAFNYPIALSSANKSSQNSTLEITEFQELWQQLGTVFDGGHLGLPENDMQQRAASTVIDLSAPGFYQIIRNGIAVQHTIDVMKRFNIVEAVGK